MRRRGNASHSRTSLPLRCFLDVGHRVRRLAASLTMIYLNLADSLCYFDSFFRRVGLKTPIEMRAPFIA